MLLLLLRPRLNSNNKGFLLLPLRLPPAPNKAPFYHPHPHPHPHLQERQERPQHLDCHNNNNSSSS